MMAQVEQEKSELRQVPSCNAENQWHTLVRTMEAWNRIVTNLVRAVIIALLASASKSLTRFFISGTYRAESSLR